MTIDEAKRLAYELDRREHTERMFVETNARAGVKYDWQKDAQQPDNNAILVNAQEQIAINGAKKGRTEQEGKKECCDIPKIEQDAVARFNGS